MWPNPQRIADLIKFTEEIRYGKLRFYYSENVTQMPCNKKRLDKVILNLRGLNDM